MTRQQILKIRRSYQRGTKQKEIAQRFGISQAFVSQIVRGVRQGLKPIRKRKGVITGDKLTFAQVREIKARIRSAGHGDCKLIAGDFGISQSMVSRIKSGECWGHIV